jgi:hypothetical protein
MTSARFRALRILLLAFSLLTALGGLVMIFSSKPLLLRLLLRPPESEITTLLLLMMKELGGGTLAFSVMLFLAYRDPVRNVAIVNACIVGLCILAVTPLLSLYTLKAPLIYPASWHWARSLGRLVLAGVLYYLRPREAPTA